MYYSLCHYVYTGIVFHSHLALEKEAVVVVASDQTSSIETIKATSSNLPRNLTRRTSSSSSAEETAYWKLESYSYVLPPIPDDCHGGATSTSEASVMTSVEPQSDPGLYINARPMEAATPSYSGLRSSTLEPPSALLAYDKLAKHNYYNMNDVNNGTKSDEAVSDSGMFLNVNPSEAGPASYSGLRSSTLEPPLVPQAYDKLVKHNYYNINDVNNGTKSDEAVSDSGMFLNVNPSEAGPTSYSGLRSSTLEPSLVPQAYDKLAKHNYYNMSDVNNGTKSDEAVSDSGMFLK